MAIANRILGKLSVHESSSDVTAAKKIFADNSFETHDKDTSGELLYSYYNTPEPIWDYGGYVLDLKSGSITWYKNDKDKKGTKVPLNSLESHMYANGSANGISGY